MLIATAQALCQLQPVLYGPADGLHATAAKMKKHPKLVMPNFAAQHARQMRQALAQRWALQQFLPDEAPNDPPAAGAARGAVMDRHGPMVQFCQIAVYRAACAASPPQRVIGHTA